MFAEAVLWAEYLRSIRHRRTYYWRGAFLVVIVFVTLVCWPTEPLDAFQLREMGRIVHLTLLLEAGCCWLFAAPYVANSVLLDRVSNKIGPMLATQLSPVEILTGKLAGGALRFVSLLLYSLPLLVIAINLGGITYAYLFMCFAVILALCVLSSAAGLLAGFLARGMLATNLAAYVLAGLLICLPIGTLLGAGAQSGWMITPGEAIYTLTMSEAERMGGLWSLWIPPVIYCLLLSLLLVLLCRPVLRRLGTRDADEIAGPRLERYPKLLSRYLGWISQSAEETENAVAWRELRSMVNGWPRLHMLLLIGIVVSCGLAGIGQAVLLIPGVAVRLGVDAAAVPWVCMIAAFVLLLVLVLSSVIVASVGFINERRSGSVQTLVLTGLSNEEIIRGKIDGIYGYMRPLLCWPLALAVVCLPFAFIHGSGLSYLAFTLSLAMLAFRQSKYQIVNALENSLMEEEAQRAISSSLGGVAIELGVWVLCGVAVLHATGLSLALRSGIFLLLSVVLFLRGNKREEEELMRIRERFDDYLALCMEPRSE